MIRVETRGRVDLLAPVQTFRRYGVPIGGSFDPIAARALEHLLPGEGSLVILECSGADVRLIAELDATIAYWSVSRGGRTQLRSKDSFVLPLQPGVRGWIAFRSDHSEPSIVTTLLHTGSALRASSLPQTPRTVDPEWLPRVPREICYVPNEARNLGELDLRVDLRMDRKGIQLNGDLSPHQLELPSAPTTPGSLQWTPNGSVLLLGPDGPTIGGYPPIGTVPAVEFSKVAQLQPLTLIRMVPISLDELLDLERTQQKMWAERLVWLTEF